MSFQEFESIFSNLNDEFQNLRIKIGNSMKKYSDLEKQLQNDTSTKFKCNKCDETFQNIDKFQKHKESTTCDAVPYPYHCKKCDLLFTSEKQLTTHQEKHGNFACEKCDKIFSFEGVLEKHITAVHGEMKIFCHYYNNNKECPFKSECIFSHSQSKECVYGNECERFYCMFRHENHFHDTEENTEEDNEEETENDENCDIVRISEIEPVISRVESAMKKVSELLKVNKLKCDKCDFIAKNQNGLNMHSKAKHTVKSV